MSQLQAASPETNAAQIRAQEILTLNLRLAEAGAAKPTWLREQLRLRRQQQPVFPPTATATAISPTQTNTSYPGTSSTPERTESP